LLAVALPASAAEAPHAVIIARTGPASGVPAPVTVAVDFGAVAEALGLRAAAPVLPLVAGRELPDGGLEPVPVQFDPTEPGSPAGDLTLLLPAVAVSQRVRVYFTDQRPELGALSAPGLTVTEQAGAVTVGNQHYRVTHDRRRQGGLPSTVQFVASGKVCAAFSLNDRIYNPEVGGGFRLAEDPEPGLDILSRGPLRAVVRVRARYLQGGKAPPTQARAEYAFSYYAGSPRVRVRATMTQDQPQNWHELHLWEFNTPDASFSRWLTGKPAAGEALKADQGSHPGGSWGALADGPDILAVVGTAAIVYDGRGGYGTYVHGPWVGWGSVQERLEVSLFIGQAAPDQIAAVLDRAADEATAGQAAVVTVGPLEAARQALQNSLGALPATAASRWRWLASLAARLGGETTALPRAVAVTRQLAELAANRAPVTQAEQALRQATGEALCLLSNAAVGWAFAREAGALRPISCYDFATRSELIASSPVPLWETELQRPDKTTLTVSAAQGTAAFLSLADGQAELTWTLPPELGGATVRAALRLDGPAGAWTLALSRLAEGWAVRTATFPQIAVGPLGPTIDDDCLILPQGSGVLHKAPLRSNVSSAGHYPDGWASFQMMAYYGPVAGVYVACHDPLATTKQIVTHRTNDAMAQVLAFRYWAPNMGVAGNGFRTDAPTIVRPFQGDWFDATQIYRAWAEASAQWWPRDTAWGRTDTPQWMKEVCVWALSNGTAAECVAKVKEFAAAMGAPTAYHWYSWHEIPFDVKYPHYFPTKPGMKEGVAELQAAGVRVMPYINGRLWDTQLEDFQQTAIAAATKGEDGKPFIEEYGSGAKLAPMCPTQKLWQDKVREIVLRLTNDIGVDGVYIDQIGAAAPRLCMDPSHGHPLGGGHWWTRDGYWPLLTDLQASLAPGKMITTECNAEPYARWFDGYLTWHWQFNGQVPAFSAIYGGRIQLFSRAYNGSSQRDAPERMAHWMRIGQQLVFGEQLGWIEPAWVLKQPDTLDFLSRAARTRHALLDFLAYGRMARPPAVGEGIPEVTADWAWSGTWMVTTSALQRGAWWAEDGRLLLLFANVSGEPVQAEVTFRPEGYGWPAAAEFRLTPVPLAGKGRPETHAGTYRLPLALAPREIAAFELRRDGTR